MASRSASHRRMLPSTSVNSNVTVPEGNPIRPLCTRQRPTGLVLLALDVDDLAERVPHLNQVGRVGHHLVDDLMKLQSALGLGESAEPVRLWQELRGAWAAVDRWRLFAALCDSATKQGLHRPDLPSAGAMAARHRGRRNLWRRSPASSMQDGGAPC